MTALLPCQNSFDQVSEKIGAKSDQLDAKDTTLADKEKRLTVRKVTFSPPDFGLFATITLRCLAGGTGIPVQNPTEAEFHR